MKEEEFYKVVTVCDEDEFVDLITNLGEYHEELVQMFNDREKEDSEYEPDCRICLNLMVESCLLPCKHRICYQCIKMHREYLDECPVCQL